MTPVFKTSHKTLKYAQFSTLFLTVNPAGLVSLFGAAIFFQKKKSEGLNKKDAPKGCESL